MGVRVFFNKSKQRKYISFFVLILLIALIYLYVFDSSIKAEYGAYLSGSPALENENISIVSTPKKILDVDEEDSSLIKSLEKCRPILFSQKNQYRELFIPKAHPIKGEVMALPKGFSYQKKFRYLGVDINESSISDEKKERLKYIESNAIRIEGLDEMKQIAKECQQWMEVTDKTLSLQASTVPISKSSYQLYHSKHQQCVEFDNAFFSYFLINDVRSSQNKERHRQIVGYMRDGQWERLIEKIESGDIAKDYQELSEYGLRGRTLLQLATIQNAPKDVFEKLLKAGVKIYPQDISHAAELSNRGALLNVLIEKKYNFNQVFDGKTIYDIASRSSDFQKPLLSLMEKMDLNPNLVIASDEDPLAKALRAYQFNLSKGRPINMDAIKFLLKQGAVVTASHYDLVYDGDVKFLLDKYQCD